MSKWRKIYENRVITAEDAVSQIKSGDDVVIAHALGAPVVLIDAMVANKEAYHNVVLHHMLTFGGTPYADDGMQPNFWHNSFFAGATNRKGINNGLADFTPAHFSDIPGIITERIRPDVLLCQVSPPDASGYVSLGLNSDYTMPTARAAKKIIAEVNPNCPRVFGDTFLHVSDIQCFVETNRDIVHLPQPEITEVEKTIGRYCAELISDGDTLQLGIGAIPDSVLFSLDDKKDLGVHSEIVADGVQHLVEEGIINGTRKTKHIGKVVATSIFGTSKFHKFVNDHQMFELYPSNYTNDVRVIAEHDNLISINSCLQMDIAGQVCSDTLGTYQFSGIGGQSDFVRGANLSKGGKAIMALYSAAKNDTISKIVPVLDEGASVATLRADIDYVVTEYGIAQLKGQTLYNRAQQLIAVAHPNFRDELKETAEKRYNRKITVSIPMEAE